MRSGGDKNSETVPEETLEIWKEMDPPEESPTTIDNIDCLLPFGDFYTNCSPLFIFTALYLYLGSQKVVPQIDEKQWKMVFKLP